ncbi:MAG TPA: hypothetical protein VF773_18790 [Verrucomicrobiae bacterium]
MASLNIPETEFDKLKSIAELPQARYDAFLNAIREAGPAISLKQFAETIKTTESKDVVRKILTVLAALFSIRERESLDAEAVSKAVVETTVKERPEHFSTLAPVLESRLQALLSLDNIGITAKGTDVLTEHERTFCHARVLTDIRPIFSPTLKAPEGAVIVQMLQIGFRENGKHKEFYVALDTEDVVKLRKILERAEAKTLMLESFIKNSPMKYLKV